MTLQGQTLHPDNGMSRVMRPPAGGVSRLVMLPKCG